METVDVIVIGAGIAGASAAYALSEAASVLLLEREDQPGYHTTGRSAAVFAPAYGNRPIRQLTAASRAFYDDRAGGLAEGPVLKPRGELLIARSDQLNALDRAEADLGQDIDELERLDADQAIARMPALRPGHVAAALADSSAMDMDVAAIHQGFLAGFRRRGGRLLVDAEVTTLRPLRAGWEVVSKAGTFRAEVVINAGGAWADEIADLAGAARIGLVPKRRTAFIFDPNAPIDPNWPVLVDVDEAFYFRPESGLLLGSPADETPSPPVDAQPEELDVALAVDRIERATVWRIARITRRWAGLRSFVADMTPVVGFDPALRGFFWLAGQG
ncbi:MAG: FAD-binding oxidoreductase, partial [Alphaproteobacteria bacterium]|nr:FAD-binding oxidoreductase [Alphaproteobacteria bacterium]